MMEMGEMVYVLGVVKLILFGNSLINIISKRAFLIIAMLASTSMIKGGC